MSIGKNFYYAESAPQLLSVYRHIIQNNVSKFDILVRLNGSYQNDIQIHQVLSEINIFKQGNVVSQLFGFQFFVNLFLFVIFSRYSNVCVADIRSKIGLIAIVSARCEQIVLLDDGTATFDYYQQRVEGVEAQGLGFIKWLLRKLSEKKLKNIRLHSMLPLMSVGDMTVELSELDFSSLFEERNVEIDKNLAIFIGSKVVETGACTNDFFAEIIEKFVDKYSDYKLQYIAHREENTDKLNSFAQIEVLRLPRPLELEFGFYRNIPSVICTLHSAGIVHFLPYRKDVKLVAYQMPLDSKNIKFHSSIILCNYLFKDVLNIDLN
jgi:hypothetical protein